MDINRRQFLNGAAAGGAAACAAVAVPDDAEALTRPRVPRLPEAVGLLYDSTICVGCKACVAACKTANDMPPQIDQDQERWNPGLYDSAKGLSGKTLNVILVYRNGTMEQKDRETDGFAFIKRQCLHCVDPSCVSCCPVTAMIKDPVTGIVRNDPDRCIGCRYCVYACPFQVPQFDLSGPFGRIHKCELCRHRLAENQLPGCVEGCPTGATLFGRVEDLRAEARRRLALQPGDTYDYPRGDLSGKIGQPVAPNPQTVRVAYYPDVYGENVLAGTQTFVLSAVRFDKLGLPYGNVPETHSYASMTEGIQHFLYRGMIAPTVTLVALSALAYRASRQHHAAEDDDAEQS